MWMEDEYNDEPEGLNFLDEEPEDDASDDNGDIEHVDGALENLRSDSDDSPLSSDHEPEVDEAPPACPCRPRPQRDELPCSLGLSDPRTQPDRVPTSSDSSDSEPDEEEDDEEGSPAAKSPKMDLNDEDDGMMCSICCDAYTNSGPHRVCSLRCGHIFGLSCVEKWLSNKKRCPACCSKARSAELRILYVKSLKAVDTTEVTAAKAEVDKKHVEVMRYQLTNQQLICSMDQLKRDNEQLKQEKKELLSRLADRGGSTMRSEPQPGCSKDLCNLPGKKQYLKVAERKTTNGLYRVGTYSSGVQLLVVSERIRNNLYPNGSYGIKQFDAGQGFRELAYRPLHVSQIRDLEFQPEGERTSLLSVGLDKKAIIYDVRSNINTHTFRVSQGLWSGCWNAKNPSVLYLGLSDGNMKSYDLRFPQQESSEYRLEPFGGPVGRMKSCADLWTKGSTTPLAGLLVHNFERVCFVETQKNGLFGENNQSPSHIMPVDGAFISLDFDQETGHFLASTRPSGRGLVKEYTAHLLSQLEVTAHPNGDKTVSSNLLHTFQGGKQEMTKICRSALMKGDDGTLFVCGNGAPSYVKVWNTKDGTNQLLSPLASVVNDIVHCKINESYGVVCCIMDNEVSCFKAGN